MTRDEYLKYCRIPEWKKVKIVDLWYEGYFTKTVAEILSPEGVTLEEVRLVIKKLSNE